MSIEVLHLLPRLGVGGGSRAAIATVAAVARHADVSNTLGSLRPPDPTGAAIARSEGISVLDVARGDLTAAIGRADIVQLHFWNSPELLELLERELPPMRLLLWPHVAGNSAPQVLPPELVGGSDLAAALSEPAATSIRRAGREPAMLPAIGDARRVRGITRSKRPGFNVGYVGTVGSVKLHPAFAQICAAIQVPEARFIVCGLGDLLRRLPREAAALGIAERFELLGQVEDIGAVFADLDVFGYPLRADTYASADLALMEAMYAGVPPVVLRDGTSELLVEHGRTGLVADDPDQYARWVERLHADPEERRRLSRQAREHAERTWSDEVVVPPWTVAYEGLMAAPKRERAPLLPTPTGEHACAQRFIRGLGADAAAFRASLAAAPAESERADEHLRELAPQIGLTDGGLLDFARRCPDCPFLALWSGIFLRGYGRPALSVAELSRAVELGCPPARVEPHLEPARVGSAA